MARCRILLTILAVVLPIGRAPLSGDEPPPAPEVKAPEPALPPVFLDERARGPVVAAQVVASGNGLASAAYLRAGLLQGVWLAKPARDPRVDKGLLAGIEQRRSIKDAGKHEIFAYNYLVLHAHDVSHKDLSAIARTDVFARNLYDDPQHYVGEPVRVVGRLVKLTRMDAPRALWNDGIKSLYEGWLIPAGLTNKQSFCIVLSELPKNVKMGEKVNYEITCDAYFFKLNRFQTDERDPHGQVRRDLPLLIGRSLVVVKPPSAVPEEPSWSISGVTAVLPYCVGVIALLIAGIIGMNWWYKRGDRAVQSRIADARGAAFAVPPENGASDLPAEGPKTSRFSTGE